jgi:hypothetical protein
VAGEAAAGVLDALNASVNCHTTMRDETLHCAA